MNLITAAQRQKLLENGRAQRDAIDRQDQVLDFEPVHGELLLKRQSPCGTGRDSRVARRSRKSAVWDDGRPPRSAGVLPERCDSVLGTTGR
jgi:hypothetical protein